MCCKVALVYTSLRQYTRGKRGGERTQPCFTPLFTVKEAGYGNPILPSNISPKVQANQQTNRLCRYSTESYDTPVCVTIE